LILAGGVGLARAESLPAEGQVGVWVASGRHFIAEVDRRTDAATLWLRWAEGSGVILRPIQWQRVVRVEIAGQAFSGDVVRRAVVEIRRQLPLAVTPPPPAPQASMAVAPKPPTPARTAAAAPRRVRTLEIEASLGHWGPNVDNDGLLVEICPLDEWGEIVPVQGTIEAELIGQGKGLIAAAGFAELGHWVENVWPEEFGYRGARCRLPFQAVQPELDFGWAAKGVVHVRLSVPGEGVFEASAATTRIRPASQLRDNNQESAGRRFFPNERTSRWDNY
jgi:hypothetical protein